LVPAKSAAIYFALRDIPPESTPLGMETDSVAQSGFDADFQRAMMPAGTEGCHLWMGTIQGQVPAQVYPPAPG